MGAVDAILAVVRSAAALPVNNLDGVVPAMPPFLVTDATVRALNSSADKVAKSGGTPLAVAKDGQLLGIIHLKDIIKGGIKERFGALRDHPCGVRRLLSAAAEPQYHASYDAAERYSISHHFQRADHRRADPLVAARARRRSKHSAA